ncbi:uncharacterized protein LOC135679610 [Musa acuminata AAA Group]|uniref:uncharacterized protein LOC135679610 n=1 Tax=Musa acuminata AAA Group TaxID=214697 RepID=UPI0031D6598E
MEGHVGQNYLFGPKTLSPSPSFAAAAATTVAILPAVGCATEGGVAALACKRHGRWLHWPCSWAPPRALPLPRAGAAPSAGDSASPSGRPCEVFARGSSGHKRRCPAAHHQARVVAAGIVPAQVAAVPAALLAGAAIGGCLHARGLAAVAAGWMPARSWQWCHLRR